MRTKLSSWMAIFLCSACFYACGDNDSDDDSGGSTNAGTCNYTNTFSMDPECREYSGNAWTAESAAESCESGGAGAAPGVWSESAACALDPTLGTCSAPDPLDMDLEYVIRIGGDNPADCGAAIMGCGFSAGVFTPSALCTP